MTLLLLFRISLVVMFALSPSASPNQVDVEELPDCRGVCEEKWGTWNNWDECTGGICHVTMGKKTRENICFVSYELPSSRGDTADEEPTVKKWRMSCRETENKDCVSEITCPGIWSAWEEWTLCAVTRNANCFRSRRRFCHHRNGKRLSGQNCFGGLDRDTEREICNATCPHSRMSSMQSDAVTNEDSMKDARQPEKSVDTRKSAKGHNTILISVVAIGSLVFGVVFVLLILNLVRKYRHDGDNALSDRARRKRVPSTNTSSTGFSAGYTTAGDVLSPRSEVTGATSATSITATFAAASNAFDRCNSRCSLVRDLPEQLERPRQSRILQENVYWEIPESASLSIAGEVGESPIPEQVLNNKPREEVDNVLYESRV